MNPSEGAENEVGEEDTEDDEGYGDERDIWSVTHVTEEDFEPTDGEGEDLYDKLMEIKVVFFNKSWRPHKICTGDH